MNKRISVIIGLLLISVSSCRKPAETGVITPTKPSIEVLETSEPVRTGTVCGTEYSNVLRVYTGRPVILKMRMRAGERLSEYKVDIHSNFDCHVHQKPTSGKAWSYLKVSELNGKDMVVTEEMPLPADAAAGNYHCIIRLLDEVGNEAPFVEYNIQVVNTADTVAPTIMLSSPVADSISVEKGGTVTFLGRVTDNGYLSEGRLVVDFIDSKGERYSAFKEFFGSGISSEYELARNYVLPPYVQSGLLTFVLTATDKYNNSSERKIKVTVQ